MLSALTDHAPVALAHSSNLFEVGQLTARDYRDGLAHPRSLVVNTDLTAISIMTSARLSLETALFPFLFSHNEGAFDGRVELHQYLQLRVRTRQLFSPFTLFKPYLLLMFQIRQAIRIVNATKDKLLEKHFIPFRKKNPQAYLAAAIKAQIKWKLSDKLPTSPAWFRKQFNDLKALVQAHEMPSFFLTLTADETSEFQWHEVDDLESFLDKFNAGLKWHDAPVECAMLFKKRLDDFMKQHILKEDGLLGRVTHNVIRLEVQHRGSLHAHIMLRVHEDDIERIASEIMAFVPAEYDTSEQNWILPDRVSKPNEYDLVRMVLRKQMHEC